MSDEQVVKIVGERNSGTNLVHELFRAHTEATIVPSTAPQWAFTVARLLRTERVLDWWFSRNEQRSGGWKHAHADELVRSLSSHEGLRDIAVVFVVRDPWAWLPAMHRRPYHWPDAHGLSFEQFLTTPMPVQRRESTDRAERDPIDVWNWKIEAALRADKERPRTAVVRHEDFLADTESSFERLSDQLRLVRTSAAKLPATGVKRADAARSADDYRAAYEQRRHLTHYDDRALVDVATRLDNRLVSHLGYPTS